VARIRQDSLSVTSPTSESPGAGVRPGSPASSLSVAQDDLASLRDATLMMVDDDPILVEVLGATLEEKGYANFVATTDPLTAVAKVRELKPDLLFLDMVMPGRSGIDVLRELRADPAFADLPVIVLTASGDARLKLAALELGAADFLAKPVDPSELVLRLRNTLAAKAFRDRLANYDSVTGLPNRRMFLERLAWACRHAQRYGSRGVLMHLDIDRFKQVNDALGPSAGDLLLKQVGERLLQSVRSTDAIARLGGASPPSVARLGGDEFTALFPTFDPAESAAIVADRLIDVLGNAAFEAADGQEVFLGASIGIAILPDDGADADTLLKNAGAALREAKADGRCRYRFYSSEFNARALHRLSVESELRRALERDELRLHFQPKVDAASERTVGAEVLVRWQHPERGLLGPFEFIPIAESSGLIVPLGDWVFGAACRQLALWRDAGLDPVPLSINVSALQFRDLAFIDRIAGALAAAGLGTDMVCIELTETVILDKSEPTTAAIARLRDLGIELSIDDFGAGFTSLSYLKRLPFAELKIDKSFVDGIETDADSGAIVAAVIALAQNLGLRVVAEGVETRGQHAFLRAKGCDECQGYLFSRPLPADVFEQALRERMRPRAQIAAVV